MRFYINRIYINIPTSWILREIQIFVKFLIDMRICTDWEYILLNKFGFWCQFVKAQDGASIHTVIIDSAHCSAHV